MLEADNPYLKMIVAQDHTVALAEDLGRTAALNARHGGRFELVHALLKIAHFDGEEAGRLKILGDTEGVIVDFRALIPVDQQHIITVMENIKDARAGTHNDLDFYGNPLTDKMKTHNPKTAQIIDEIAVISGASPWRVVHQSKAFPTNGRILSQANTTLGVRLLQADFAGGSTQVFAELPDRSTSHNGLERYRQRHIKNILQP